MVGGLCDLNLISQQGGLLGRQQQRCGCKCLQKLGEPGLCHSKGQSWVESVWSQEKAVAPQQNWTKQALTPTSISHSPLSWPLLRWVVEYRGRGHWNFVSLYLLLKFQERQEEGLSMRHLLGACQASSRQRVCVRSHEHAT